MILSPQARKIWDALAPPQRLRLLNQVWCVKCMKPTSMGKATGKVEKGRLILCGVCTSCGGVVATSVDPQ